ncbi:MAG: hypothetical protein AAB728_05735, partial [Patescibacteria group bacterium]
EQIIVEREGWPVKRYEPWPFGNRDCVVGKHIHNIGYYTWIEATTGEKMQSAEGVVACNNKLCMEPIYHPVITNDEARYWARAKEPNDLIQAIEAILPKAEEFDQEISRIEQKIQQYRERALAFGAQTQPNP